MTTSADHLFAGFVVLLLDTLTKMVPGSDEDAAARSARRDIARILFEAFKPTDALEAMLAARAVAAHHATMDGFMRAALPGLSNDTVIRLRNSAFTASRAFDAVLRRLDKQRAGQAKATAPAARTAHPPAKPTAAQPASPQPDAARADLATKMLGLRPTIVQGREAWRDSTALSTVLLSQIVKAGADQTATTAATRSMNHSMATVPTT